MIHEDQFFGVFRIGARVVLVGRNKENLAGVANNCKNSLVVVADVADDVGSLIDGSIMNYFDKIMSINLIPHLIKTKDNVVNTSSVWSAGQMSPVHPGVKIQRFRLENPVSYRNRQMIIKQHFYVMLSPLSVRYIPRLLHRNAHTQAITKNILYISNDDEKIEVDKRTMKIDRQTDRPICIMLNWLLAGHKQVMKYANIYLEDGFDVMRVSCQPWQLMWPKKGTKLIGQDLINIMAANDHSYVVHGFSVGGYVWSEAMVHAMTEKDRYQPALDRVEAQVWDSVADITEVPVGVPFALFPNNKVAQMSTKYLIKSYLNLFKNIATVHYKTACETYYRTPCRAPSLFLLSSLDPVGNEKRIRRAYNLWLDMGIQCTWQCWPDSAHVMHYPAHPDEYVSLVRAHLRQHATSVATCDNSDVRMAARA